MRLTPRRAVVAALVLPFAAASCSTPYPASPVPAVLSPAEAQQLATAHYLEAGVPPGRIDFVEKTGDGYLMNHVSDFDASRSPVKENHLVFVKHDGTVRAQRWDRGD